MCVISAFAPSWVTGARVPLCEVLQAGTHRFMALSGAEKLAMPSLNGSSQPNGGHHGSERKPSRRLSGYRVWTYLMICLLASSGRCERPQDFFVGANLTHNGEVGD